MLCKAKVALKEIKATKKKKKKNSLDFFFYSQITVMERNYSS